MKPLKKLGSAYTRNRVTQEPVLKSLTKIIGGKTKTRDLIYQYFPGRYTQYIEPFMGSCTVFMGTPRVEKETVGDINPYAINFYKYVQNDPWTLFEGVTEGLIDLDKEKWLRIRDSLSDPNLTLLDRAVAYYIVNKASMNAIVRFNTSGKCNSAYCGQTTGRGWMTWEWLWKCHKRLKGVDLLNLSYHETVAFATKDSFTYLDPPYFDVFTSYDKIKFSKANHIALADVLKNLQGKFLLSINDHRGIRNLYEDCYIYPLQVNYSCSQAASGRGFAGELLISNYSIDSKHREVLRYIEQRNRAIKPGRRVEDSPGKR